MERLREALGLFRLFGPIGVIDPALSWLFKRIAQLFRRLLPILVLAVAIVVVIEVIAFLYDLEGSGFSGKTLWDWLSLLIVPLILAVGGIFINSAIQRSDEARTQRRAEVDQQIADDRLKEQALQNYLDRMSELLLSGQFDNPDTKEKARTVARARTLTVLRGLDGERKAAALRFLYESKLLTGDTATIDLGTADLSEANLAGVYLRNVHLEGTHLERAHLRESDLYQAHLEGTNLEEADLTRAHLEEAYLKEAYLAKADCWGADFRGANLEGANLQGTQLQANLERANLSYAILFEANLEMAKLYEANLKHTNFIKANLFRADVTREQLKEADVGQTTMLPDGSHPEPSQSFATFPYTPER